MTASALRFVIVHEPVLDRHRVSKDAPDAVSIVAMLQKVAVVGVAAVGQASALATLREASRAIGVSAAVFGRG
jgi:hypothetical protein